jgi:hypothetical protein
MSNTSRQTHTSRPSKRLPMIQEYNQLLRSTEAQPSSSQDLIVLAIDCSEPEQPRSYTHLRCPHVCFGSCLRDIDPRINPHPPLDLLTDTARADHKLWRRILGCDSDVSASALSQSHCSPNRWCALGCRRRAPRRRCGRWSSDLCGCWYSGRRCVGSLRTEQG